MRTKESPGTLCHVDPVVTGRLVHAAKSSVGSRAQEAAHMAQQAQGDTYCDMYYIYIYYEDYIEHIRALCNQLDMMCEFVQLLIG